MTDLDLFDQVLLSSELDLKGYSSLDDKKLLNSHPKTHLEVLKYQKNKVEYQFSSHKATIADYRHQYVSKRITLEEYTKLRKEQFLWKARATSFLMAIEQKMIEMKEKGIRINEQ